MFDNWETGLFDRYNGDVWSDAVGGYVSIYEEEDDEKVIACLDRAGIKL